MFQLVFHSSSLIIREDTKVWYNAAPWPPYYSHRAVHVAWKLTQRHKDVADMADMQLKHALLLAEYSHRKQSLALILGFSTPQVLWKTEKNVATNVQMLQQLWKAPGDSCQLSMGTFVQLYVQLCLTFKHGNNAVSCFLGTRILLLFAHFCGQHILGFDQ